MAENKFIKHLKGTETAGSVLEIKNQGTPATFGNMPAGTSNPNTVYADARGDATAVLKGTEVWKLNGSTLDLASRVYGDGRDFTDTYTASGSSLWVNATHTFGSAKIFGANTKWVLKLCGANLLSAVADTIDFSLIVKFGSTAVVAKNFTVAEHANNFCQQFVIDFDEWTQNVIKATSGDTMTIQLLCGDSTASATIYNGMTTLTALQRRVDGEAVASDTSTFDDLEQGLDNKVSKTGDTMSGPLTFTNTAGAGGIYGYTNGVVFFYMNGDTRTQLAALNTVGFAPYIDNAMILGGADLRWKELHANKAYVSAINNGYDIAVPVTNSADTLALKSEVDGKVSIDGSSTMTGVLKMRATSSFQCAIAPFWDGVGFYKLNSDDSVTLIASIETPDGFIPWETNTYNIGSSLKKWKNLYLGGKLFVSTINNGGDLAVPAVSGTLATKADVDLAANSGRMITDQGVWYAKMDALGTIPSSAEVEGRNYADFTQVDGNNDPIIVIYTYTSGAWVQTTTITPPSAYDGYVPITSKIWDIPEQTGQQGGRILWNHTSKDFTPYPMIVSFDGANITNGAFQGSADLSGTSTVTMPVSPSSTQIVNKDYVDTAIAAIPSNGFDLFDIKWRDSTTSNTAWALSDGNWKTNATAYQHLEDEFHSLAQTAWMAVIVNVGYWWRYPSADQTGQAHPYAFADEEYNLVYCDTETPSAGVDDLYDNYTSAGTSLGTVTDGSNETVYWATYETIAGTTVAYFRAADGHKIVLVDDAASVDAIYAATGVAWYYVLDTANQRFKLPRTQFAFVGTRGNLGDYVEAGLPDITGSWIPGIRTGGANQISGAFTEIEYSSNVTSWASSSTGKPHGVKFTASNSNAIYGNSTTVQAPATEMYLYFYVGA